MRLQSLLNTQPQAIDRRFEFPAIPTDHRTNAPENPRSPLQQANHQSSVRQAPIYSIQPAPTMTTRPMPTSPLEYDITGEPPAKRHRTGEHAMGGEHAQEFRTRELHALLAESPPASIIVDPDQGAEGFRQLLADRGPAHWSTRGDELVAHWQAFHEQCGDRKFSRMTSEEQETMMLALRIYSDTRSSQQRKLPYQRRRMEQSLLNACVNHPEFMQSLIDTYDNCLANSKAAGIHSPFIGLISKIRTLNRELPHVSGVQRINLLKSLGLS